METELKPEWGREMKRAAATLTISPDGIWKNKKFIREPMVCIFFKYLLGTFHVLKTLASLKISRAFLFKYSMCVGQPRFPHLPWWWTSCLLMTCHARKKNSWGIVQFSCIRQLFQLQKFLYVLKIAWGNYQLSPQRSGMTPQITLEKIRYIPASPLSSEFTLLFPLLFVIKHTEASKAGGRARTPDKREPMEGKQAKRKDPVQIRFLLKDYTRGQAMVSQGPRDERGWAVRDSPGGSDGKESACQCRRHRRCGFNPWVGKIPRRRKRQPTPVSLLGEFHGQRSLAGYSSQGCKQSDTTKYLTYSCTGQTQVLSGSAIATLKTDLALILPLKRDRKILICDGLLRFLTIRIKLI